MEQHQVKLSIPPELLFTPSYRAYCACSVHTIRQLEDLQVLPNQRLTGASWLKSKVVWSKYIMSEKSMTEGDELEAEKKVAEEKTAQQQKLLALQEELKATNEKMRLLQTRKTGSPNSTKQTETHKTGFPSSARSSQQGDSVEEKQRELTKDISTSTLPKGTGERRDETGGNDSKTNPESPADKSGNTLQSAGIADGVADGNTADSVIEPAAGKDVECPQPEEVHGTTSGETVDST